MLSVWVLVRRWCQTCTCIFQFQDRTVDWNIEVKQLGAGNPRTLIKLFQKLSDSIFWILSLSCLWYNDLDMSVPRKIRINVDAAPRSDGSSIVYSLKDVAMAWHVAQLYLCRTCPESPVSRLPHAKYYRIKTSSFWFGLEPPTRRSRSKSAHKTIPYNNRSVRNFVQIGRDLAARGLNTCFGVKQCTRQ